MAAENEYILFLDESNTTKYNPYLLLGGIIISRKEYKEVLIPNMLKCKQILKNPHIIFHYTDIIKKQKDFSCMCRNTDMCKQFWVQFYEGINDTNFKAMAAYINIKEYNDEYPNELSHDCYELLFTTIINNYIQFLNKHGARGSILFESREETQNRKIQQYYFHILKNGTNVYKSQAIDKYITTTSFLMKEENCIGLQVADMIAYNCIRYINKHKIEHRMWDVIFPKLYDGDINKVDVYGLVKLF